MKLSIIIPVYRTQATLQRCLESILRQSFTDYELILVDDGSDDMCPLLCDEYEAKDTRISVIHKKNGGLSDARNAGIQKAKGEYITFVDSDDALSSDTLQPLMEELYQHPDVDILEYPVQERIGHPYREKLLSFDPRTYQYTIDYWLNEKGFHHTYACNKIFKRNLFHNVSFPKEKNFEDILTIPLLIGLIPVDHIGTTIPITNVTPKIRVTNVGKYLYYWNGNGITAKAKYDDLLNLYIGQTLSLIHTFKQMNGREEEFLVKYKESLEDFMTQILNVLLDLYDLSGKYEQHPPLISRVEKLSQAVHIHSYKLKLLNILGYHTLCKLNKFIHKIYRHP